MFSFGSKLLNVYFLNLLCYLKFGPVTPFSHTFELLNFWYKVSTRLFVPSILCILVLKCSFWSQLLNPNFSLYQ